MYPRSGFWYRGTSECTFVPFFFNIRMYSRSVFVVLGNIRQNHPFGNHPVANPQASQECQAVGKGGSGLREQVAVMTEAAKTVGFSLCPVFGRTSKRRARCSPELLKTVKTAEAVMKAAP